MSKTEKLYHLHTILSQRRTPAPKQYLMDELGCSQATLYRLIGDLRAQGAPIESDTERGGFVYERYAGERAFELPGFWMSAEELHALISARELLSRVQTGLMQAELSGLEQKITSLLNEKGLDAGTQTSRIRIINQASRRVPDAVFNELMTALTHRRQLEIRYRARGRAGEEVTERVVSPQRLTSYRNNWYLDAWCHLREGLRSFALERIEVIGQPEDAARELDETELNSHYAESYGIFSGPAAHTAEIRFSPFIANWVADEIWHSRQQSSLQPDGSLLLSLPFGRAEELIMDLMRYGSEVEVLSPPFLREELIARHQAALAVYQPDGA